MQAYRHVLFATDLSPGSRPAGRRAGELARSCGARLTVLHVVDYFPEDMPTDWIWPENVDPEHYLTERAHRALSEQTGRLQLGDAERHVRFSRRSAPREIAEYARDHQVDLVVLGSHGHGGVSALLGSTSDGVLHRAVCDVLVVRAGE